MTSKDCGHHDDDDDRRQLPGRVLAGILSFIILILFVILLIWLILRPAKPRFILQDATVYSFNVTQPNLLTTTFQVTISTRNPNDRIGVYYEHLDAYASYRNQQITLPTTIPATYQGHHDVVVWSPFLYGNSIPVAPYLADSLSQDQNAGLALVNIKISGRVKWKVGTWISGRSALMFAKTTPKLSRKMKGSEGNKETTMILTLKFEDKEYAKGVEPSWNTLKDLLA